MQSTDMRVRRGAPVFSGTAAYERRDLAGHDGSSCDVHEGGTLPDTNRRETCRATDLPDGQLSKNALSPYRMPRECEAAFSTTLSSPGLDRVIQYAAAPRLKHDCLWNTGSPAFAGDDIEPAV